VYYLTGVHLMGVHRIGVYLMACASWVPHAVSLSQPTLALLNKKGAPISWGGNPP